MAKTKALSKEERKKARRAARKKRKAEHPLKPREYARGSKKRKMKRWRADNRSGKVNG